MIGKTLGHYKVGAQLGLGGMGEVFSADDLSLGRKVALKFLPDLFTGDHDRMARFEREAKLLAALNHPNIGAIYGLEQAEGKRFLVLELVEGETLADQIKRGPIPVEDSLNLALQIAEALEAAHEKGVIHRDLKPANIMVKPDGRVKVLDFGLAKAFAGDQSDVTLTYSPTLSEAATQQGVILGTAAYMSPEQAKGKTVDKRADIWAFGVVLFEMMTGKRLFIGESISEVLAAVLKSEPEWNRLPPSLHPRLRLLLERCLEKDSKNRYHDIADVRVDLQKVLADPSGVVLQPITAVKPRKVLRLGLPWIAAAVVLTAIIAGLAVWRLKPSEPRQIMRFNYDLLEGQRLSDLGYQALDVSPSGKQFVYSTLNGLYIRSVDELTAKLISGSEGSTTNPFFSPDGKWIGYFSAADSKLKKIAVNGGAPVALCDVTNLRGAWWNKDGTIVYSQFNRDLMRISANGGTPESIAKLKSGGFGAPQILPGGKFILYTFSPNNGPDKIMMQSLKSGETRDLFSGFGARYLPTGHLIFRLPNNSNLFAIPFDPSRPEVTGPVTVLEGVRQYAISDSGTLAYVPETPGGAAPRRTLIWVNREGKEDALSAPPNEYLDFRISPDGRRVALSVRTPTFDIWIWDVVRETLTRLTLDEGAHIDPLWTLDGKRIVYSLSRENIFGAGDIYRKAADGTGEVEKLASSPGRGLFPWSWSGDGKTLVLWEFTLAPMQSDIGLLSMEGDHVRKPLLQESFVEKDPRISQDGKWMAYASNESGKYEVYVRPFPEVNQGKWQVSTSGGNSPLWSPDSRELYYRSGDAAMAVPVETAPSFKAGKATVLFRSAFPGTPGVDTQDYAYWDISPDGKFLMLKPSADEAPRKINIVVNWFEELRQRVPVK